MSFSSILIAAATGLLSAGLASGGENDAMMIGEKTGHSAALVGATTDSFYGLQITSRGRNACQVRAFFRGAVPQAAQFCRGRVRAGHVRDASVAVLGQGERLQGLSACLTRRGTVGSIRLHTQDDEIYAANMSDCNDGYTSVECQDGWAIQGLELYFDGPGDGRSHRRLRGLRPLCSAMPTG